MRESEMVGMARRCAAIMLTILMLVCEFACAHPGGVDENGGHYDKKTGEYHYHHGYPAHTHIDGVCEYEEAQEEEQEEAQEEEYDVIEDTQSANISINSSKPQTYYVTAAKVMLGAVIAIGILGYAYDIPSDKKKSRRKK